MVVHLPDLGFSSISIASSSELAITPISITHIASELVVQRQQQRPAPHKQPFSNWADGVARHTGAIPESTTPVPTHCNSGQNLSLKHKNQQQATVQVAMPMKYILLSRTKTQVAAHKNTYTLCCVNSYYDTGWFYSPHIKGAFSQGT